MPSPKIIGYGILVLIVAAVIGLFIYTGSVGLKNLSWQTTFFVVAMCFMLVAGAGFAGFKIGSKVGSV